MHLTTKILDICGSWRSVANAARTTIGKEASTGEVSDLWKKRILLCEHSPIRKLNINWKWNNLKYWVSVHFVRHKFGIEHYVKTQRPDRTGETRDDAPQDSLINHECFANAQSIINISRKRLCYQATADTRNAWIDFLNTLQKFEPVLVSACVPDCIYRGYCYEFNSCGYHRTSKFKERLKEYRRNVNERM